MNVDESSATVWERKYYELCQALANMSMIMMSMNKITLLAKEAAEAMSITEEGKDQFQEQWVKHPGKSVYCHFLMIAIIHSHKHLPSIGKYKNSSLHWIISLTRDKSHKILSWWRHKDNADICGLIRKSSQSLPLRVVKCFIIQIPWNINFLCSMISIGWQNLNPLSHPNAKPAPQARPSGEILNYLLSC